MVAEWFSHGEMIKLPGISVLYVRQFEGMAVQGHLG